MSPRMFSMEAARGGGYSAVIRSPDGVLFAVSAASAAERAARLVEYISEWCEYTLWPTAAAEVRALIDAQNSDAAIEAYFANVGARWDEEQLECRDPSPDDSEPREKSSNLYAQA